MSWIEPKEGETFEEWWGRIRKLLYEKPDLSDERLFRVIMKEARRDYFCGWGRIFMDEFAERWNCPPQRLLNILKQNGATFKWIPGNNVVLIKC